MRAAWPPGSNVMEVRRKPLGCSKISRREWHWKRRLEKRKQPMRVLLTGGSGLLGSEFLRQAPPAWDIAVAVHRNSPLTRTGARQSSVPLDITNREQVK